MMKDKIRILKDFSAFDYTCHFCHKQTHLFFECPKIHYIPDRDFLIKKMNFSVAQDRAQHVFRRRTRKINALFQNFKIHLASLKFNNFIEEEDEEEEFDSNVNNENEQDLPLLSPEKFIRGRKSKILSAAQVLVLKENEKNVNKAPQKSRNSRNSGEFLEIDEVKKINFKSLFKFL